MDKLKPCPFCGGEDIKFYAFKIDPEVEIICNNCGAMFSKLICCIAETQEEHEQNAMKVLTELWNRRGNK